MIVWDGTQVGPCGTKGALTGLYPQKPVLLNGCTWGDLYSVNHERYARCLARRPGAIAARKAYDQRRKAAARAARLAKPCRWCHAPLAGLPRLTVMHPACRVLEIEAHKAALRVRKAERRGQETV